MQKKFKDIDVGTEFTYNSQEMIKINDIRITCCKVYNATINNDPNQKHFVVPIHEVEVADND
jgi:hypothetical protein